VSRRCQLDASTGHLPTKLHNRVNRHDLTALVGHLPVYLQENLQKPKGNTMKTLFAALITSRFAVSAFAGAHAAAPASGAKAAAKPAASAAKPAASAKK